MSAEQFRREFEKWSNLLAYARKVNDVGGMRMCERKLNELAAGRPGGD